MQLAGATVVVTGAGGGIGRELVVQAVARGARVAAVDIRQEALDETAAAVADSDRVATFVVDITDRDAVAALPAAVEAALGPTDVLVNNAGIIQPFIRLAELDDETIDRVIDVNLYGPLNMVRAFLPGLLARPAAHVLNVSSMGGFLPVPGQTIYGAAKAGVKLMTEGLYAELLDTQVGVTVVMPGAVATDITGNSGVDVPGGAGDDEDRPNMPITEPADAAETILDGIEHGKLYVFVGLDARLLNIATRIAPRQATHLIQSQMKRLLDPADAAAAG
ncbi:MAG TPA: SDR family NAD(P)-dependent oxidoreductase [Nitriliruptoraceae bacterium]|nr:SDR family NAD(P)-dependent oxidoreductase [Nitriliruptoraceae bacterium]